MTKEKKKKKDVFIYILHHDSFSRLIYTEERRKKTEKGCCFCCVSVFFLFFSASRVFLIGQKGAPPRGPARRNITVSAGRWPVLVVFFFSFSSPPPLFWGFPFFLFFFFLATRRGFIYVHDVGAGKSSWVWRQMSWELRGCWGLWCVRVLIVGQGGSPGHH